MAVKRGLGRGIDALIAADPQDNDAGGNAGHDRVLELDINKIEPNREQPRRRFEENELRELADSIRQFGVISPIIVRREDGYYTIVAGERRWRAARMAGLSVLPAVVREYDELDTLQVALIENIQRADLNPVEEARSFKRLIDDFGMTQERVAEKLGKSRSGIANALRLLSLDEKILDMLESGALSAGHAKAVLSLANEDEQVTVAAHAVAEGLSVRELERLVSEKNKVESPKTQRRANPGRISEYARFESGLHTVYGTKVNIKPNSKGGGKIELEFFSPDDLDRLLMILNR